MSGVWRRWGCRVAAAVSVVVVRGCVLGAAPPNLGSRTLRPPPLSARSHVHSSKRHGPSQRHRQPEAGLAARHSCALRLPGAAAGTDGRLARMTPGCSLSRRRRTGTRARPHWPQRPRQEALRRAFLAALRRPRRASATRRHRRGAQVLESAPWRVGWASLPPAGAQRQDFSLTLGKRIRSCRAPGECRTRTSRTRPWSRLFGRKGA